MQSKIKQLNNNKRRPGRRKNKRKDGQSGSPQGGKETEQERVGGHEPYIVP